MSIIGWKFVRVPDDLQFNILRALANKEGLTADEVEEVLGPDILSMSLGPHRLERMKFYGWVRSNESRYFITEKGKATLQVLTLLDPK